jgi:hypothetical protein
VDLRSNGHGLARAWWTAPCTRCTGPRWTGRITRRGTRSGPSTQDLRAQDACKRDAAAASPESGGARRGLAGVAPGRRSRPSTRPQASAKRRGGACARDRGVKGGDRASSAPAPEGGGAAAPASSWRRQNAQEKGISSRGFCSPCVEEGGELKTKGRRLVRKLGDGGGSGGAPAGGDPSSRRCAIPVTAFLDNKRHVRDTIAFGEGKDRATGYSTDGVRRRGDAEAAAPVELVLECVCWCDAGAKGSAGARARA